MKTPTILNRSLLLTINRVADWLIIIAVGLLVISFFGGRRTISLYGIVALLASILLNILGFYLEQRLQSIDNYADSIHQSIIENFFISNTKQPETTIITSLPEIVNRTTFNRPDVTQPLDELYKTITTALVITTVAVVTLLLFNKSVVYFIALAFASVYISDRLFAIRSKYYLSENAPHTVDKSQVEHSTDFAESIIQRFSKVLELDSTPKIIYSKSDALLAGAVNPIFSESKICLSTKLLEKKTHIQAGIIAHEMAHIKLEETHRFTHKYIQLFIPSLLLLFTAVSVTIWSSIALFIGLFLSLVFTAVALHQQEFEADELASELTNPNFLILGLLEFTNHNPFSDAYPSGVQIMTKVATSHPPTNERIQRLLQKSGQTFNSEK